MDHRRSVCGALLAGIALTYIPGARGSGVPQIKQAYASGARLLRLRAFALVGMGAVFAGVVRAPITSVLIIIEMTAGYGLTLPLMISNMAAYRLARRLRPTPIYEAHPPG